MGLIYRMMRNFIVFICLCTASICHCQVTDTTFTEDELTGFVRIRIAENNHGLNVDSVIMDAAVRSGISMQRLGEILRKGLENSGPELTANEKSAMSAFQAAHRYVSEVKNNHVNKLCIDNGVTKSRFEQMMKFFRSSISFQQKLVPYFKKEIEN